MSFFQASSDLARHRFWIFSTAWSFPIRSTEGRRFVSVGLLLFGLSFGNLPSNAEDYFGELRIAADEMKPKIANLMIHYRFEAEKSDQTADRGSAISEEYAVSGRRILTQINHLNSSDIWVQNEVYSFQLAVRGQSEPSVNYINHHTPSDGSTVVGDPKTEEMFRSVCVGFVYANMPVADLIRLPDFRLKGSRRLEVDEQPLVRFDFHFPEQLAGGLPVTDSYFVCDPAEMWVIVESGMTIQFSDIRQQTTIFREPTQRVVQGVPIASGDRVIETSLDDGTSRTERTRIRILDTSPGRQLFTLSHFGLPEPGGTVVRRPWMGYLSAIVVGVVLLVLARRWNRRHVA